MDSKGMRPLANKECDKTENKTRRANTILKRKEKESASLGLYAIFVYIPALTLAPLYWTTANFKNPHGCTISDISSMLLHVKHWTRLQWPAVLHSENEHVLHTLLGSGSKGYNNWMTFSSSLFHTSYPSRSLTQPDFPRSFSVSLQPFFFFLMIHSAEENLVLSSAQFRLKRRWQIEWKLASADELNPSRLQLRRLLRGVFTFGCRNEYALANYNIINVRKQLAIDIWYSLKMEPAATGFNKAKSKRFIFLCDISCELNEGTDFSSKGLSHLCNSC